MALTFAEQLSQERERLSKEREEIFNQQHALEEKLHAIVNELAALDAYEAVKHGKPVKSAASTDAPKNRKGPAPGTPRKSREAGASIREATLSLIKQNPNGLLSKDVDDMLKATGVDTKSLGNVLSTLKKEGLITQEARRTPYFPASKEE